MGSEEEDLGDYMDDGDGELDEEMFGGEMDEPVLGTRKSTKVQISCDVVGVPQIKALMGSLVINMKRKFDYAPFPESFFLKNLRKDRFMTERAARRLEEVVLDKLEDSRYHEVVLDKRRKYECCIMGDEYDSVHIRHFGCGHTFEEQCMREYINQEINRKGPACIESLCPFDGCEFLITQKVVDETCEEPKKQLFMKFSVDNFVHLAPYVIACLNPKCELFFLASEQQVQADHSLPQVYNLCRCGSNICLGCRSKAHEPLKCDMFRQWEASIGSILDSLNENWKRSNSKKCPGCKVDIQKNEGCMHMTCAQCKHEFCWLCMGDWKKHGSGTGGFFKCNMFHEDATNDAEKADVAKLQFYTDRFFQHRNSLELSEKKYQELELSLSQGPADGKSLNLKDINETSFPKSLDFYREGFKTILKCRSFITFTYPLAYFIKNDKELKLFLENQYMLEFTLEKLDKFYQKFPVACLVTYSQGKPYLSKEYPAHKQSVQFLVSHLESQFENAIREFQDPEFLAKIAQVQKTQTDKISNKFFADKLKKDPKAAKSDSSEENNWLCSVCTYYNPHNATRICTMCSSPGRPASKQMTPARR